MTGPASSGGVESVVYHECPVCRSITLGRHCKDKGCRWLGCHNRDCKAVLDNKRGLGYRRDPKGRIDPRTKSVGYSRLIFRGGVWLDRDAGPDAA